MCVFPGHDDQLTLLKLQIYPILEGMGIILLLLMVIVNRLMTVVHLGVAAVASGVVDLFMVTRILYVLRRTKIPVR